MSEDLAEMIETFHIVQKHYKLKSDLRYWRRYNCICGNCAEKLRGRNHHDEVMIWNGSDRNGRITE